MSSKGKLKAKLTTPASDKNWTLGEAELVLAQHGFSSRPGTGSHRIFIHPQLD